MRDIHSRFEPRVPTYSFDHLHSHFDRSLVWIRNLRKRSLVEINDPSRFESFIRTAVEDEDGCGFAVIEVRDFYLCPKRNVPRGSVRNVVLEQRVKRTTTSGGTSFGGVILTALCAVEGREAFI